MRVKLFTNTQPLYYQTGIQGYPTNQGLMHLSDDGWLRLDVGICSDGCSPTFVTPFGVIGPWNGFLNSSGEPQLYRAFMLHDGLLQEDKLKVIPRKIIHEEFCRQIAKTEFPLRKIYCSVVKRFGPKE